MNCLDTSIKHWEENLSFAKEEDEGAITVHWKNCACCLAFFENACAGCPIYEYTDRMYCDGTPYWDVVGILSTPEEDDFYPRLIAACQAEVNFLLLVKENTK